MARSRFGKQGSVAAKPGSTEPKGKGPELPVPLVDAVPSVRPGEAPKPVEPPSVSELVANVKVSPGPSPESQASPKIPFDLPPFLAERFKAPPSPPPKPFEFPSPEPGPTELITNPIEKAFFERATKDDREGRDPEAPDFSNEKGFEPDSISAKQPVPAVVRPVIEVTPAAPEATSPVSITPPKVAIPPVSKTQPQLSAYSTLRYTRAYDRLPELSQTIKFASHNILDHIDRMIEREEYSDSPGSLWPYFEDLAKSDAGRAKLLEIMRGASWMIRSNVSEVARAVLVLAVRQQPTARSNIEAIAKNTHHLTVAARHVLALAAFNPAKERECENKPVDFSRIGAITRLPGGSVLESTYRDSQNVRDAFVDLYLSEADRIKLQNRQELYVNINSTKSASATFPDGTVVTISLNDDGSVVATVRKKAEVAPAPEPAAVAAPPAPVSPELAPAPVVTEQDAWSYGEIVRQAQTLGISEDKLTEAKAGENLRKTLELTGSQDNSLELIQYLIGQRRDYMISVIARMAQMPDGNSAVLRDELKNNDVADIACGRTRTDKPIQDAAQAAMEEVMVVYIKAREPMQDTFSMAEILIHDSFPVVTKRVAGEALDAYRKICAKRKNPPEVAEDLINYIALLGKGIYCEAAVQAAAERMQAREKQALVTSTLLSIGKPPEQPIVTSPVPVPVPVAPSPVQQGKQLAFEVRDDEGGTVSRTFPASVVTIGRALASDIVLDARNVSREHAVIDYTGENPVITNHSAEGTKVNGKKVEGKCELHDGDMIRIGRYTLMVFNPSATTALPPATSRQSLVFSMRSYYEVISTNVIPPGDVATIGSDKDSCSIYLNHEKVSPSHAIVEWKNGVPFIRDCNSKNGTYVNGDRVTVCELQDGDEITLGPSEFYIRVGFCTPALGPAPQLPVQPATQVPGSRPARPVATTQATVESTSLHKPAEPSPAGSTASDTKSPASAQFSPEQKPGSLSLALKIYPLGSPCYDAQLEVGEIGDSKKIGRDYPSSTSDLRLKDQRVSLMHAVFEHTSDGVYIVDLGSVMGITLNDQRVKRAKLKNGDILSIGDTIITITGMSFVPAQVPSPSPQTSVVNPAEMVQPHPDAQIPITGIQYGQRTQVTLDGITFTDGLRVKLAGINLYAYPRIILICGGRTPVRTTVDLPEEGAGIQLTLLRGNNPGLKQDVTLLVERQKDSNFGVVFVTSNPITAQAHPQPPLTAAAEKISPPVVTASSAKAQPPATATQTTVTKLPATKPATPKPATPKIAPGPQANIPTASVAPPKNAAANPQQAKPPQQAQVKPQQPQQAKVQPVKQRLAFLEHPVQALGSITVFGSGIAALANGIFPYIHSPSDSNDYLYRAVSVIAGASVALISSAFFPSKKKPIENFE